MINNSYSLPFSVFILGTSYLFWRYVTQRKWGAVLPIPASKQASWIWGHELKVFQREASEMYVEWAASLGLVYRIKAALFQSDIIIVGDNSAAQHILQNSYTYVKPPAFLGLIKNLTGDCLASAEGEDHKYQRRLLAPAFTSGAVEAMTDDIFFCVEKMTQNLRSTLTGTDANVVDMAPVVSICALEIIGRVGFGHDFESTEVKAIRSAWHEHVIMSRTFTGFMAPILINVFPWITRLPIPAFRDSVVRQITYKLAGKLLSENSENMSMLHGNDILSILVNSRPDLKENLEAQLTTAELLDNISLFMLAGHESSAITVSTLLLELAQNPKIQQKLRREIRTVASLDYNNVVALKYLDAVTKEGLRLHPVTTVSERVVLQDDVIPLKQAILGEDGETLSSFAVKAGQIFRIPWTVLNVNEQVWGNNASQFIPERWIDPGGVPPADKLPHGPWGGVSSFADGPRNCIGYRLAVLEIKIILAVLLFSFEFECTEAKIVHHLTSSLQPFADGKAGSMPLKVSLVPES